MEQGLITCPNCGHEFELSDALTGRIREHLKAELLQEVVRRESEVKKRFDSLRAQEEQIAKSREAIDEEGEAKLKERLSEAEQKAMKKLEGQFTEQLKEMREELEDKDQAIRTFRQQEVELRKRQRELEEAKESMELEISRRIDGERDKIRQEAAKKLDDQYANQLADLKTTLEVREKAIEEFRAREIELRKRQRELEDSKKSLELDVARKVDEEREKIREEAAKKAAEEHRLKDLEKDKVINDLRASLEDMKRKAEQGSMETQGEVLEQDFEGQLRAFFPHDDIQPVPKGIRGADLVQSVRTPFDVECGVLLWETKNTKAWSAQWIPKLKDNMIETRAVIAILVSVVLPAGMDRFGQLDGVWVSDPPSAIPVAAALREQLIAVNRERTASIGKNEKMEALYQYLAGVEFKQKIEGIVEAFTSMQDQLNQERRAMERHWRQREKQIERVIKNTVGLYGDMQGIIGGHIPAIPALDLDGETLKQLPDWPANVSSVDSDEDEQPENEPFPR
jgi:hypothetical protein